MQVIVKDYKSLIIRTNRNACDLKTDGKGDLRRDLRTRVKKIDMFFLD